MANAIDTRINKLSEEYNATVKELRELRESKRKPSLSDAEVKSINDKIKELESKFTKVNSERNRISKMKKSAEEYLELNKDLKELNTKLTKARTRGEDTEFIEDGIKSANTRLKEISPDIEREFPELKVTPIAKTNQAAPKGTLEIGPDGRPTTTVAPTPTPTTTPTTTPTGGTTTPPKSGAKPKETTPAKESKTPPAAKKVLSIDEIIDAVANEYGSIDTIFKTDPGLQALLRKAIGKDGVPNTDDDLTPDQFVNELENTDWFKTNASAVRQRGFYKRQFDDLVAGGADPEELYKTTEYGRGLRNAQQVIADEIVRVGGNLSPEEIELISRDIYDLGYENQKAIVSQRIRAKIRYKPGGIVGGEAGENLAALRKTAAANGLSLEKNFGDSLDGWLQKLAQGESIETFKQIIRGSAKIGLPEKVSGLLDNGVDLDTIYNPYKRLMASVLEINPESITLDDSVLRSAIGPDKEMSLYDFQKMLRKDNRWQYTNQAKEEVSNTALRVLRDFGFQG
jgi:hypothetical protein